MTDEVFNQLGGFPLAIVRGVVFQGFSSAKRAVGSNGYYYLTLREWVNRRRRFHTLQFCVASKLHGILNGEKSEQFIEKTNIIF